LLSAVNDGESEPFPSGVSELDRVLGGGFVPGSSVLIGGEPGVGKSTLALQIAASLTPEFNFALVAGEESSAQVLRRAKRLGVPLKRVAVLTSTDAEGIAEYIMESKPSLITVDSIQTIRSQSLDSPPGSVAQIRESTLLLSSAVRAVGSALLITGHITKGGVIAGPKLLEHIVDVVLYLEGDREHSLRFLRCHKNRYGSTGEMGVFEMTADGLISVLSPTEIFLESHRDDIAGTTITASMEGRRALFLEVQALTSPTRFSNPQRVVTGVDSKRALILAALLERRIGLPLGLHDVFVNVVGGMRLTDPGADMAVVMAMVGSLRNIAVLPHSVFYGEIGLTGEVRKSRNVATVLSEASRLGFEHLFCPAIGKKVATKGIIVHPVGDITELFKVAFRG